MGPKMGGAVPAPASDVAFECGKIGVFEGARADACAGGRALPAIFKRVHLGGARRVWRLSAQGKGASQEVGKGTVLSDANLVLHVLS